MGRRGLENGGGRGRGQCGLMGRKGEGKVQKEYACVVNFPAGSEGLADCVFLSPAAWGGGGREICIRKYDERLWGEWMGRTRDL